MNTVPAPDDGEAGYILEVFNALGESVDGVTVPQAAMAPLRPHVEATAGWDSTATSCCPWWG